MPKSKLRKGVKKKDPANKSSMKRIGKRTAIVTGSLLAFAEKYDKEINRGV